MSRFSEDHDLPEFQKLCELTAEVLKICIRETKALIDQALEGKTIEAFNSLFLDNNLFKGIEILIQSGFYKKENIESYPGVLRGVMGMRKQLTALLTTSAEQWKEMTTACKFTYFQQMGGTWIKHPFQTFLPDDQQEWCAKANKELGIMLPNLFSVHNLKEELSGIVTDEFAKIRKLVEKAKPKEGVDPCVEAVALCFRNLKSEWLCQEDAMEATSLLRKHFYSMCLVSTLCLSFASAASFRVEPSVRWCFSMM